MKRRDVKRAYEFMPLKSNDPDGSAKPKEAMRLSDILRRLWHYSPYIIALTLVTYAVFFSNLFLISRVDVQGPNTSLSQGLKEEADKYLSSRLLGRNWLFMNGGELKTSLQKTFTGQESIIVQKSFPNRLSIKTDEQKPSLVWKTGSKSYVVSVNGSVMSELQAGQLGELPLVNDNSNIPTKTGDRVVGRDFVDFTNKVFEFIKSSNLGPSLMSVSDTTVELRVQTTSGYEIRFNSLASPESQIRSLSSTLDLLAAENKKPSEYIDLRVDGRAFYK